MTQTNGNLVEFTSIGELLSNLMEKHRKGEIVGIVVGMLDSEDYCRSYWAGESTYLSRLGLAENLKAAMVRDAISAEAD